MSVPQSPKPAKLIVGLFLAEKSLIGSMAEALIALFGEIDLVSAWLPFELTDYYTEEMGAPLYRRLFAFKQSITQDQLAAIKLKTDRLESQYIRERRRRVNIDPGYLLSHRFVLATGKDYAHRIYVGKGIYADLTLLFQGGGFVTLPWTYPDYARKDIQNFLQQARHKYMRDLKTSS